eukprot:8522631-Pyramimonas_sp.AAC.1
MGCLPVSGLVSRPPPAKSGACFLLDCPRVKFVCVFVCQESARYQQYLDVMNEHARNCTLDPECDDPRVDKSVRVTYV